MRAQTTAARARSKAKPTARRASPAARTAAPAGAKAAPRADAKGVYAGPGSEQITERIRELGDWRGKKLALVRKLIHQADPAIIEEWKWMGTPVWSHDGLVCTGETYKQVVKLTFGKGAFLEDPHHLFNASLAGGTRRAIDIRVDDEIDGRAFRELIQEAVAFNQGHPPKRRS